MWNGTSMNRAAQVCFTLCVVSRRSFDRCMPPCSATERSRLMTRHTVRYGRNHSSQYTHGCPTAIDTAMRTSCTATMRRACVPAGPGDAHRAEQSLEQLPAGLPGRVADELAPEGVLGDRVAAVEGDVGLVGAEFLAVVRHVPAAVEVDRRERGVAEQPAPDPVVRLAVAEEQPVRGLVHQRRELCVRASHEQEHRDPHEGVVQPHREPDEPEGLDPARRHRERVAQVRDAAQLFAERGRGPRDPAFRRSVGWKPTSSSGAGTIVPGRVGCVSRATSRYYTLSTDGDGT